DRLQSRALTNASPPRTVPVRSGRLRRVLTIRYPDARSWSLSFDAVELGWPRGLLAERSGCVARGGPSRVAQARRRLELSAIRPVDAHRPASARYAGDERRGPTTRRCNIVERDIVNRPFPTTGTVVRETEKNLTLLTRCRKANRFDLPRSLAIVPVHDVR